MNKYVFDLRDDYGFKSKFQLFPTAVAALHVPENPGDSLSFLVRGVIINDPLEHAGLAEMLSKDVQSCLPTSLYLAGWATITFQQIHHGRITVCPFVPRISPGDLKPLCNNSGKPVRFVREWGAEIVPGSLEYGFDFLLEQPLAYVFVATVVSGPIQFTINPADCVTFEQSCDEFDRWDHDWYRVRQLREVEAFLR